MAKTRGKGEGSVFQRTSDMLWVGRIELGYEEVIDKESGKPVLEPNGLPKLRRKYKQITGKNETEVRKEVRRLTVLREQGKKIRSDERQTLNHFLTHWLETTAKSNLRASTFNTYSSHVKNHLIPSLGRIQLTKLEEADVETFLAKKLADGKAPRTVWDMHTILSAALGHAAKRGLVSTNVAAAVKKPRIPHKDMRVFTPDEASEFLGLISGERFENLFIVTLSLALRRGEVLGIRWKDLDLDRGILTLRQAIQPDATGKSTVVELKTKGSYRSINLPSITIEAFLAQRERQLEERKKAKEWVDGDYVFTTSKGTPLSPRNFKRELDKVLAKAELEHINIHALRHSGISLLISAQTEPKMIQEIAGHSRIGTTMDIYGHLFDPMRHVAASAMDTLLRKKVNTE